MDRLLVRRQGIRCADRAGGPEQARLPPGRGRVARGCPVARNRGAAHARARPLQGARDGPGAHPGHPAQRSAGGLCRSHAGRGRPGLAGAQPQPQLAAAGRHVPAPQLGGADGHGPDGNHRPAPLRAQGGTGGWRWRAQPDPGAVRHPAHLAAWRGAGCPGPGHGAGAAQRHPGALRGRGGGRIRHQRLRHRSHRAAHGPRPAAHQRSAAAGARGRPFPRPVHPAQHHRKTHAAQRESARHRHRGAAAITDAGSGRIPGDPVGCDRASGPGPEPAAGLVVGDRRAGQPLGRQRRPQGQPAHRARGAAGGAASHAGAAGRPAELAGARTSPGPARRGRCLARRAVALPAALTGRRFARGESVVHRLPVCLPGAKGEQGHRPARRGPVVHLQRAVAGLPRRRWPGQLLPAARRRRQPGQRHAHRPFAGGVA